MSFFAPDLAAKRLDYILDILPHLRRLAFIWNPANPLAGKLVTDAMRIATATKKIDLVLVEVRSSDELHDSFLQMASAGVDAVAFQDDGLFSANSSMIADIAIHEHLPAFGTARDCNRRCALVLCDGFFELCIILQQALTGEVEEVITEFRILKAMRTCRRYWIVFETAADNLRIAKILVLAALFSLTSADPVACKPT